MPYKTILAILSDINESSRVLDQAAWLAEKHGSHVIGLHATPLPVVYSTPMGFPDTDFIAVTAERNKARTEEIKALFEARMARDGFSGEWRSIENFTGDNAVAGLSSARAADIVIAAQADPAQPSVDVTNLHALLFETGRPVLFAPYLAKGPGPVKKVLVGWNGTRESARAVFDAMPFILAAEETEILMVDPPATAEQTPTFAASEIAATLARHGAKVTTVTEYSAGLPVSAVIQNRIAEKGADLFVMGAFSHARFTEWLFGGVTRNLIRDMPILTLMSR